MSAGDPVLVGRDAELRAITGLLDGDDPSRSGDPNDGVSGCEQVRRR